MSIRLSLVRLLGPVLLAVPCVDVSAQAVDIRTLSWLTGCWEYDGGGWLLEEIWSTPKGNSMLGMSRTLQADSLRTYELVVLEAEPSGVRLTAHPLGQPSAVFQASEIGPHRASFENPEHDYPQRIVYEPVGADSLSAWIDGSLEGVPRRVDFGYRRVACGADH